MAYRDQLSDRIYRKNNNPSVPYNHHDNRIVSRPPSSGQRSFYQNGYGPAGPGSYVYEGRDPRNPPGNYNNAHLVEQNYLLPPHHQQPPYFEQPKLSAEEAAQQNNPKVHQNAEAIVRHNNKNKKGLREGKHAAAVDQIHENDLHNIKKIVTQQQGAEDGKRQADPGGRKGKQQMPLRNGYNIPPDYSNNAKQLALHHRPRVKRNEGNGVLDPDTELSTSFDPIKDRHLWTMWRTAVNGRIVDEVRHLENARTSGIVDPTMNHHSDTPGVYGKAIVAPPLKRFIRMEENSREIADHLSRLGKGQLGTSQFVYYGLPRVDIQPKADKQQQQQEHQQQMLPPRPNQQYLQYPQSYQQQLPPQSYPRNIPAITNGEDFERFLDQDTELQVPRRRMY